MIEEAAGTRLYESKKEAAQRTIEKKDMKLKEIDTVRFIIIKEINYYLNCSFIINVLVFFKEKF
jgi:chromosome segregation ATPase